MNAVTRVCALLTAVCLLTLTVFAALPEEPEPVVDSRGAVQLQIYAMDIPLKDLKIAGTALCCVAGAGYSNQKEYQDTMVEVRDKISTSDPGVLEVRYHETDPRYFYITPVSFGQAKITFRDGTLSAAETVSVQPRTLNFYGGSIPLTSTPNRPFPLIDWLGITPCFDRPVDLPLPLVSSDESVVLVEKPSPWTTARDIKPKKPGRAVLTYSDGCYQAEMFVEVLEEKFDNPSKPGFHVFAGPYEMHRERLTLEQGERARLCILYQTPENYLPIVDLTDAEFSFSQSGIVQGEPESIDNITGSYSKFYLYGMEPGDTIMTCSAGGETYSIPVTVTEPEAEADPPLLPRTPGFYAWDNPFQVKQDSLTVHQEEMLDLSVFANFQKGGLTYAWKAELDQNNFSFDPSGIAFAEPYRLASEPFTNFYLHGLKPGKTTMTYTGDGQTYSIPVTVTEPEETPPFPPGETVAITKPTVEAINKALEAFPAGTTFLLPSGRVAWSKDSAITISKENITLQGRDTVFECDVNIRGKNIRLEDLEFDVTEDYNSQSDRDLVCALTSATSPPIAVWGDGSVTFHNCKFHVINGTAISLSNSQVWFEGKNVFNNCRAGLVIEARAGRTRPYASGLVFKNCNIALKVADFVSETADPYFYRFTECNFLGNDINVQDGRSARLNLDTDFNVSNNYFQGGKMDGKITDYPRYQEALDINQDGTVSDYPLLTLPPGAGEIPFLNEETPAPIAADSFSGLNTPLTLSVRQLNNDVVQEAEDTQALLEWNFENLETEAEWPDFRPSAYIDETFPSQWTGGIDRYQGIHFLHNGDLPLEGARVKVKKQVELKSPLYLYEVSEQGPVYAGAVTAEDDAYCFDMGHCSDYIVTDVKFEQESGGESGENSGGSENGGGENSGSGSRAPALTTPAPPEQAAQQQDAQTREPSDQTREAQTDTAGTGPADTPENAVIPGGRRESNGPGAIPAGSFWNKREIQEHFESAQGNEVSFDVVSKPIVSGEVFEMLKQSPEMTLVLRGDGYIWSFKGTDILNGADFPDSFDTTLSTVSPNLSKLKQAAGDRPFQCAYFSYHGPLPFQAEISIAVKGTGPYDVEYFSLDTQTLEPVSRDVPVKDGCVSWEITHCSDYVLFPLSPAVSAQPVAAMREQPPARAQPESGAPWKYWTAAGIAVILCGAVALLYRKTNRTSSISNKTPR